MRFPAGPCHRGWRAFAVAALLTVALASPTVAGDASHAVNAVESPLPSDVAAKQGDLQSLRSQIESMRREMAAAEESRRDALDQLREAERAISSTQRELRNLTTQIGKVQATLRDLESQARDTEQRLNAQQRLLEKLLYRQYLQGNPDPLRLFLNGDDANQVARDLHYLEAIGRARRQILVDIESTLQRKQDLAAEARQQTEQLSANEARKKEEMEKLLAQRQSRQATLEAAANQIATQRREIGNLQRNEKHLAELVDRLARIIAAREAEARDARREAQRRDAARERTRPAKLAQGTSTTTGEPAEPAAAPLVEAPPQPAWANLARMKGQLRLPTRGAVSNRFGAVRQEGGTWKGLFILASSGANVHSIADGRVVFAEWMRGFGNLMIVDHGGSYLSIYANNDALVKQVGDEVHAGETIATVGNSGGNPETGLYFEIRHQGKPLDPLAWVSVK